LQLLGLMREKRRRNKVFFILFSMVIYLFTPQCT
jgi:hypothetical protein